MTFFFNLRLGKHYSCDGSEDIPKSHTAVYANPDWFETEVSCGVCGFCDGWNCQVISLTTPLSPSSFHLKKWSLGGSNPGPLFEPVFVDGNCWWSVGLELVCMLEGSPQSQREEELRHTLLKGSQGGQLIGEFNQECCLPWLHIVKAIKDLYISYRLSGQLLL